MNKNGRTKIKWNKNYSLLSSHQNKNWWGQCKCKKVSRTKIGGRNKNKNWWVEQKKGQRNKNWWVEQKKGQQTKIGEQNKNGRTKIGGRNKKKSAEQKLVSRTIW